MTRLLSSGVSRTSRARGAVSAAPRDDEVRLAALDVGSNSLHMIIAQVDAGGGVTELWRGREMVGLGRASFPSHRLSLHAMERAELTLRRFAIEAQRWQCEHVVAVATSAVREAENGGEFIERVRRELGIHLRVVSARDEARLIYLGVRHAINLGQRPHFIFDLGGGSVEFIVADSERPLLLASRKVGAARMTARFVKSDPIEPRELKALQAHYEGELAPVIDEVRRLRPVRVIGTSGAIENLTAMCGGETSEHGSPSLLRRAAMARMTDLLIKSRAEERARIRGLDDKRRDQILAAALLLQEVFKRLEIEQVELCRSALREGILLDYLARHRPELEIRRQVANPRRRAILDLGRRCHWQREHGEQVARLCLRLFDQLKPLHGLGREERELTEYGALLHDVGALISRDGHHKHSMYLILNGELAPFSRNEIRTIANIARYHRRSFPKSSHPHFASLPRRRRRTVRVGAALLRLADGLDRTSCSVVHDVVARVRPDRVEVLVESRGDAELEMWSAVSRARLFERVFGRKLVVRQID
jgi:exopolyphosphatase/guanosine-5'-triphosphate,3'-diphosphate pyrophosphatase